MSVKSYSIGDNIIESKPLSHSLINDLKKCLCDYCLKQITDNNRYECEKCEQMFYCSYGCKQSDDHIHRNECKIYSKYYSYIGHHLYRLILRSYLIITNDKYVQSVGYDLYNGQKRSLNQLLTHSNYIQKTDHRFNEFLYIYENFWYFSQEFGLQLNYEKLFDLFCKTLINGFDILHFNGLKGESVGFALYINASILDHSCRPNSAAVYFGTTLVLKAIEPIGVGDEVTINYCDLELPKIERQQRLKKYFYFSCHCSECETIGEKIDFQRLDRIKSVLKSQLRAKHPDWETVNSVGQSWIDICSHIYSQYHPEMISNLLTVLKPKLIDQYYDKQTQDFIINLKNMIIMMFGTNHYFYKYLVNQCLNYNIIIDNN